MNTFEMILRAVEEMNMEKPELERKHQELMKMFRDKNLEEEYQRYMNTGYEIEKLIKKEAGK